MSKQAADHHKKAAEHNEHAAQNHKEAAKYHAAGEHEKAAHYAHLAHAHHLHVAHHSAEAPNPTSNITARSNAFALGEQVFRVYSNPSRLRGETVPRIVSEGRVDLVMMGSYGGHSGSVDKIFFTAPQKQRCGRRGARFSPFCCHPRRIDNS